MRAILVSSLGAACAAALAAPIALPSTEADRSAPVSAGQAAAPDPPRAGQAEDPGVRASTRTISLAPLALARDSGRDLAKSQEKAARGIAKRAVKPFSLLGVTWDDASAELHGAVQVRTRGASGGAWSSWQDVQAHNDDAPDSGSAERLGPDARGSTAPLWVGRSDAVEVRVVPDAPSGRAPGGPPAGKAGAVLKLPGGLRLDMVDPGDGPEPTGTGNGVGAGTGAGIGTDVGTGTGTDAGAGAGTGAGTGTDAGADAGNGNGTDVGTDGAISQADAAIPDADQNAAQREPIDPVAQTGAQESSLANSDVAPPGAEAIPAEAPPEGAPEEAAPKAGPPYIGPRPRIVTRAGWRADEGLREGSFLYTGKLKIAFVHHSATGNNYTCSQAPAIIRSIYRYHVKSSGWRDIGYNFMIDKCGNIYEGRAGGVTKPVMGAHTYGFNRDSMGIAVLGTFTNTDAPAAAVRGVAQLTAWKLGLFGVDPKATVVVTAGGGKFRPGTQVRLHTVSGHRDGFVTECPGRRLYDRLGEARASAAAMQGRGPAR